MIDRQGTIDFQGEVYLQAGILSTDSMLERIIITYCVMSPVGSQATSNLQDLRRQTGT